MRGALVATVAVLIRRLALRTGPLDEAVGEERARRRVVELGHFLLADQAVAAQGGPNLLAILAVLLAVRAAVVVEVDLEAGEVVLVGLLHPCDEFLLADALLPARIMIAVPWVSSAQT